MTYLAFFNLKEKKKKKKKKKNPYTKANCVEIVLVVVQESFLMNNTATYVTLLSSRRAFQSNQAFH